MIPTASNHGSRGQDTGRQSATGGQVHAYHTARKFAPYARQVIARQRAGHTPNVYVYAGTDSWEQATHRLHTHGKGSALALPPDQNGNPRGLIQFRDELAGWLASLDREGRYVEHGPRYWDREEILQYIDSRRERREDAAA